MTNKIETDEEYQKKKLFIIEYSETEMDVSTLPVEQRVGAVFEKMEEMFLNSEVNFSFLKKALKAGIDDIVSQDHNEEDIKRIDEHMKNVGTFTLTQMLQQKSKRLKDLIKLGRFEDEEDAIFVSSILEGPEYLHTKKDINKLKEMQLAFEKKIIEENKNNKKWES